MAANTVFDNAQFYAGKTVFSPWSGFGVPVEDVPAESVLANDIQLPAMAGMEVRAEVLTKPAAGTVTMDSYGRVTATGLPDGTHIGTYTLWLDNVAQGDGTYTINVANNTVSTTLSSVDAQDSVSSFSTSVPISSVIESTDQQDSAFVESSVPGVAMLASTDEQDVVSVTTEGGVTTSLASTDAQDAASITTLAGGASIVSFDGQDVVFIASESLIAIDSSMSSNDAQDAAFMYSLKWGAGLPARYYITRV